jgi:hypothetical protein
MPAVGQMRRTSALLLFGLVAVGDACARAPAPTPLRPNAGGLDLRQLAADMDDPSAGPLWAIVAPELKALVAARIPASLSPADRRHLGENWVDSPGVTERCDGRDPQEPFLSFVAGWALLEELAWSPASDQRVAAAAALYDRLRKEPFTGFIQALKLPVKILHATVKQKPEKLRDMDHALCLGPVRELIASHTIALERHFGAEILRAAPSAMMATVLRDEEARRIDAHEFQRALAFAAAAVRLLPRTSDVWLELAKVSYQADDVARGDDALAQALRLGADPESEQLRTAKRFQILAHEPSPKTFEQSLARFWALFEMHRMGEARALVGKLRRQRPSDARALLGDVWLNYVVTLAAGGSLIDVVHTSYLSLSEAGNLTERGPEYDRAYLSLAFQESFVRFIGSEGPVRSDPAFVAAVGRARGLSKQLASSIPDDAGLYGLSLDLLETGMPADDGRARDSRRRLGQLFPRALAVYAAHPSAESYRILLGLSLATDDWSAAAAAIMAPLRFEPGDDDQLALFRAQTFVSAAIRAKDWGRLQSTSSLLATVSHSSDRTNDELDVLRADALMLRAVHGEPTLWRSSWLEYQHTSWAVPAFDRDRAMNNLVAISNALRPDADTSANWSSLRAVRQPDWPVLVNGAAEAFRAGRVEDALAILKSRSPGIGEQRPDFVADWLACLEGASPKDEVGKPAAGENPVVEIVDDRSKQGDGSDAFLAWSFSTSLGFPPGKPTLVFSAGAKAPWLIASPRLCWTTRKSP